MMSPEEVEFLSEKEMISIVPNFTFDKFHLISGDFGPFVASIPVRVPLWLAVHLKQMHKCRIIQPDWMNVELLEKAKQDESESPVFMKMPSEHYVEISQRLFETAIDDILNADRIRTLVKDIWDLRMAKLRLSIDAIMQKEAVHAALDHLTRMEINSFRPLLVTAANQLHYLKDTTGLSSQPSQPS